MTQIEQSPQHLTEPNIEDVTMRLQSMGVDYYKENQMSHAEFLYYERFTAKLGYLSNAEQEYLKATALFMMKVFHAQGLGDRNDGSPASSHSLEAAEMGLDLGLRPSAIAMALLHDTPEDAGEFVSIEFIDHFWGQKIADGVSKISQVKKIDDDSIANELSSIERDEQLKRGLYEAVINNTEAAFARFFERLQNLRSINGLFNYKPESAYRMAEETLSVYVPLAQELGLYTIADEMALRAYTISHARTGEDLDPSKMMAELERRYPQFNQASQEKTMEIVGEVLEPVLLEPDSMRSFRPSILQLWRHEQDSNTTITGEKIPFHVDAVVPNLEQKVKGIRILTYEQSPTLSFLNRPQVGQLGIDVQRPSMTMMPRVTNDDNEAPYVPVRVTLLTPQEAAETWVSVHHLFQTLHAMFTIPSETIGAASTKLRKIRERLSQYQTLPESQRPLAYETELVDDPMYVDVHIGANKKIEMKIKRGSTVMDVLLKALADNEISIWEFESFHLPTNSELSLGDIIPESQQLHIRLRAGEVLPREVVKVQWLDTLKNTSKQIKAQIQAELTKIATGKYIHSAEDTLELERQAQIREQLAQRGWGKIARVYEEKLNIQMLIDPVHGAYGIRGITPENFDLTLRRLGNDQIADSVAQRIAENLITFRESLPVFEIRIPRTEDKPRLQGHFSTIIGNNGFNIVESYTGTERDRQYIEITSRVLPWEDISPEELNKRLQETAELIRGEFKGSVIVRINHPSQ